MNTQVTVATPLPPPATIGELRTPERINTMEPHERLHEFQAKGLNRVFIGRGNELQRLSETFRGANPKLPLAERESTAYGALLYGGPGSGKSSLAEHWQDLAEGYQHAVLLIPAKSFASDAAFVKALHRTDVWRAARALESLTANSGEVIQQVGERSGEALSAAIEAHYDVRIPAVAYQLLGGIMQLAGREPTTPTDCLEALSDAFEGGWTIAVDEAEDWASMVNSSDTHSLIQEIGDPTMRSDKNRKGGLLVAGLSDTVNILEEMKLTRFHHIAMGPIAIHECAAVIRDTLNATDLPKAARNLIARRWTATLTRDFHQWAHHTRCAAIAATHMAYAVAERWSREKPEQATAFDGELEFARTNAAEGAAKLYRTRWHTANRLTNELATRETVALARTTGNVIHRTQLIRLLTDNPMRGSTDKPEEWIQHLNHSGLLEPIIAQSREGEDRSEEPTMHLRMPIPSMAAHIEANATVSVDGSRVQDAVDCLHPSLTAATEQLRAQDAADRKARDDEATQFTTRYAARTDFEEWALQEMANDGEEYNEDTDSTDDTD